MFGQIPVRTIAHSSQFFPDFFLAKSGLKYKNNSEKSRLLCGFGFSKNKEQAIHSSQFETIEHFYATYDAHQDHIKKNTFFTGVNFTTSTEKTFLPSETVLGPVPKEIGNSADANGLGCHTSYERAVEHAILEIIERHFLAQIWYGPLMISEIADAHTTLTHFRIRLFTPHTPIVPMAIAVVDDLQNGIWALGSAARLNMEAAITHAVQEAMMLIEGSLIEKGTSYSENIEQRILSLRNKNLSLLREKFFISKTIKPKQRLVPFHMPLNEIAHLSLGNTNDIWIIDLLKSEKLNVVRALCPTAQNPRWSRVKNLPVPYDPFC